MILKGTQTQSCSRFPKHSMTIEDKRKQTIFFISVLLLLLLSPAAAQLGPDGNSSDPYKYPKFSPSMAIIIAILVAALFLMGFFSVYIRHCSDVAPGASGRQLGALAASVRRRRGLDAAVIEAFPTFIYSEVKGLKIGKSTLECAVCLNEFEDDETLRLIPKCDHVFHPECIDAWLDSHVTCPVCRANLVPQPGETGPQLPDLHSESDQPVGTRNDDVSVRVVEEDREVPRPPPQVMDRNRSFDQTRQSKSGSMRARLFGKFPRSHSTGHSLVQPGQNTERFTLRLPVDVRKQVMERALDRTTSCVVVLPSEGGSRRGYRAGVGEGSSWGGRSYRRVDRVVKSDRWVFSVTPPFFSRTSSLVTGADREGSTRSTTPRGSKTAVKLPSFKCLEPKGDETGLVSADAARCPV